MIQTMMQVTMLMQAMMQVIGDDVVRDMKYFFGVFGKLLKSLEEENAIMLMQVMM